MPLSIVYSSPSVQFTQYMELLWIQRFTQYFGLKLLDFFLFNEFKRNKLHVSSAVIVPQRMFGYCGGLRAVSLFVNRSTMFVEEVFKSTFGYSFVLFVTVVTLYHADNVFEVAVNG